jgi:hypothetical protein
MVFDTVSGSYALREEKRISLAAAASEKGLIARYFLLSASVLPYLPPRCRQYKPGRRKQSKAKTVTARFVVAMKRGALSATVRRNLLLFARGPMPPCSSSPGRPGM